MNEERNANICKLYREGSTQAELAELFHLSIPRIGQIVCQAGMTVMDRKNRLTDRTSFMGVHLSRGVKEAVRVVASEEKTSMSEWVSGVIVAALEERGVSTKVTTGLETQPLPFEEPVHEL